MEVMFLDIETTGITADNAIVTAIGICWENGPPDVLFTDEPDEERKILEQFASVVREKFKSQSFSIVTWGGKFDISFLRTRYLLNGMDYSFLDKIKHFDLKEYFINNFRLSDRGLIGVSRICGVEKNGNLHGSQMPYFYTRWLRGDANAKQKIISHCLDDVRAISLLYKRVKDNIEVE